MRDITIAGGNKIRTKAAAIRFVEQQCIKIDNDLWKKKCYQLSS